MFTALGRHTVAHDVVRVLVMGGQTWLVGSLLAAAAFFAAWRPRSATPLWLAGVGLGALSVMLWVLKVLTQRSSPHSGSNTVLGNGMSYPSRHAAAAAYCLPLGVAFLVGHGPHSRKPIIAASVAAGVPGLCTLVLSCHWVSDVIGGWLLGAAVGLPTLRLMYRSAFRAEAG